MSQGIDVSIIIVNYKTPELILTCVGSVKKYTQSNFEIIIVNNASKANDEELIKTKFPEIVWHETGTNAGFGRANNAGMKLAKGRYILLLNSDTEIVDNSIDKCIQHLDARQDAVAGGALHLYTDLRLRPLHHSFTFRRTFWILPPKPISNKLLEKLFPESKYEDPDQVDYISGAFLMMRKDGFTKTNGFDEEFFLYGEDVELGYRLAKLGKLLVFKDCKLIHDEWGSKPERYENAEKYTYFNRFDRQIQLSNIVWLRKQFGVLQFLILMLHYWLWIPTFYLIKIATNILKFKNPFSNFENQNKFALTIFGFSKYFWRILFKIPTFYKVD